MTAPAPLFLRACRGEVTERAPIWVMRQAGRYLPAYRAVREEVSFLGMWQAPALAAEARRLLALIGEATRDYLLAQVRAGAEAIQIFDSWVGVVSPEDWDDFVLEPTKALVAAVRASGVPVIYFPNGATTILERIAKV